jgi:GNAT superfamily N-acetyltransferase
LFVAHILIATVDPSDESALREWWATANAAHVDRPYDLRLSWAFTRASLSRPNAERKSVLLAAFDGEGRMVGSARLQLSLRDNTHMAYADVDVPAGDRRRGIGSGLLTEIEARARAAGRTHLLGEAFAPPGGRLSVIAAAVAPDGTLAGVSDLRLSMDDPGKAFIGITMVAKEHRGHSLGLAMKLATASSRTSPTCRGRCDVRGRLRRRVAGVG